jgi:hypothetical protein
MSSEEAYPELTSFEYDKKFELYSKNKKKRKAALERAWHNRDFEIDKFWTRSAYFWGFIALIFGAYIKVTTGEDASKAAELHLDLYLILLGIIFSTAWLLVIKGSKQWQKNWEAHIDKLEDAVTGPLYKTVYCNGDWFFSVSKINAILAIVVIVTWGLLFLQYIVTKIKLFKDILSCILSTLSLEQTIPIAKEFIFILLPIIAMAVCVGALGKYGQSSKGKYRVDLNDRKGIFVDRGSK